MIDQSFLNLHVTIVEQGFCILWECQAGGGESGGHYYLKPDLVLDKDHFVSFGNIYISVSIFEKVTDSPRG